MIARIWHGVTPVSRADEYADFLKRVAIPDYEGTEGNQGVFILRRQEGDDAHFTLITFWSSREAIKAFAGEDIRVARYYPEDTSFLREFEPYVEHYEVLSHPERF